MNDHYLLPCTCGESVRVSRAQAGQDVACSCGKALKVPTLRGLRDLEPAASDAASQATRVWTPIHGVLFASGLLAAVLGLLVALYSAWMFSGVQVYTVDQSDALLEHDAVHIDSYTPEQLLDDWKMMVAQGLGPKMTMPWEQARQASDYYRWQAIVAGAIAAVGAVTAVTVLFVGRK